MKNDWLALPGIPAGPAVWERLPVRTVQFEGVQDGAHREDWSLNSFVDEVIHEYNETTILVGHDLGGVVASMAAVRKPPRAVVLSGTALGSWWFWTRLSAKPMLNRFFYHTFKGTLFVRLGGGESTLERFSKPAGVQHDPDRMRVLAKHMKPPRGLHKELAAVCPVFLMWGKREVFYPGFVAKSLSQSMNAPLFWNEGGHYCMWTHPHQFLETMKHIESVLPIKM